MSETQKFTDTQEFADLVKKNPAAAFVQGLTHEINTQSAQQPKKPGMWSRVGSWFAGSSESQPVTTPLPGTTHNADYTIEYEGRRGPHQLNTSSMTQEQLRIRRTNVIESAKFGRPFHENVMLIVLKFWLVLGPIAFVALTTSEVAYILTNLVPKEDANGQAVIWGGALFIDLAMMFTTFGVALKRRDLEEKREANGGIVSKRDDREVWVGTLMWLAFAAINIISQAAFLLHVIHESQNPDMNILYIFVASRVVGFILGDASTAFFLAKVDNSALKLIARSEREKGALYSDIAKAEGERRLTEAKAEADIRLVQIEVEQKEQDAQFLAELKNQVFKDILSRRSSMTTPEIEGPNRSKMRRLDG